MRLVENANRAWTWFSMWAMGLAIGAEAAWLTLPADVLAYVPIEYRGPITIGLTFAGMVGRLVKQGGKK